MHHGGRGRMLDHRFVLQPQPRRTRIHQRRLGSRCVRARARARVCVCVGGVAYESTALCVCLTHSVCTGRRLLDQQKRRRELLPEQVVHFSNYYVDFTGHNLILAPHRNATINPSFHNWTMVYLRYCDGSSFSGLATSPVRAPPGKTAVFHSGNYILRGVIADLVESHSLGKNSVMRGGF